jgi:hypothetical protein
MRKSMILLGVFAVLLAFGDAASAKQVPIAGTKTKGEIQAACGKVGGDFMVGPAGFMCSKSNCDGKGGSCTVSCSNSGKCEGGIPGRKAPGRSLTGILQGAPELRQVRAPNAKTTPTVGVKVAPKVRPVRVTSTKVTTDTPRAMRQQGPLLRQNGMQGGGRRR